MTVELTDRERDKLKFLVDEYRELIGRRIRDMQQQLKRGDTKHPKVIKAILMKSEILEFDELRALSEKLEK